MMLSIDNVFVFVLIMGTFSVPATARAKVLMIGVLAALFLRIAMFCTIWWFASWAEIINKALGVFIVYCAYKIALLEGDDEEVPENPAVQMLSSLVPMTEEIDA